MESGIPEVSITDGLASPFIQRRPKVSFLTAIAREAEQISCACVAGTTFRSPCRVGDRGRTPGAARQGARRRGRRIVAVASSVRAPALEREPRREVQRGVCPREGGGAIPIARAAISGLPNGSSSGGTRSS